jgi:glycosyltransferase involved in cell wall biosynthesis
MKRVLLLSGNLKRSGVVTWFLEMHAAFLALEGVETVFLIASDKGNFHPQGERVFYTNRARSAPHLRVARWLQLHKIFPHGYARAEQKVLNARIEKILLKLGWQERIDAVIKNLPNPVPSCLCRFPVLGVAHAVFSSGMPEAKEVLQSAAATTHFIAVGQAAMDGLKNLGEQVEFPSISVIHNPLNIERIREASLVYTPETDRPYIVFVGTLDIIKGIFPLLRAFALLKEEVDLVYVGRGPKLEALRHEARELKLSSRVHFTGFQKNPYPWVKHAKLLVLPSNSEAMGYAALEGAALGCGVVVADFPASREFFEEEIIVPRLPAESFAHRLAERISQGLAGNLPCGVKQGVLESMAPQHVARKYLAQAELAKCPPFPLSQKAALAQRSHR